MYLYIYLCYVMHLTQTKSKFNQSIKQKEIKINSTRVCYLARETHVAHTRKHMHAHQLTPAYSCMHALVPFLFFSFFSFHLDCFGNWDILEAIYIFFIKCTGGP